MLKRISIIAALAGMQFLQAQTAEDALRYAQTSFSGTAMSLGMGGATGAVGGDLSNMINNPAGIGLFRQSEFTFSPSIAYIGTEANFYGSNREDANTRFNFTNLGFAFHYPTYNRLKTEGWMSSTFAFGYNRINGLNRQALIQGINTNSSIIDAFVANANGRPVSAFDGNTSAAYDAFFFDPIAQGETTYFNARGPQYAGQQQIINIESRGAVREYNLAYAGNYSNRLYVGATLGYRRIVYDEEIRLSERDVQDTIPLFNSLQYNTFKDLSGNALNFRLGAIYRANDWVRLGLAYHFAHAFRFRETFSSEARAVFSDIGQREGFSPVGRAEYRLRTPSRIVASAAFVLGKKGIISVDYEHLDYTRTRFRVTDDYYDGVNQTMLQTFSTSGNLRLGGEMRFDDAYARAGFAHLGNPFNSTTQLDGSLNSYTFGGGYRTDEFYIDAAFIFANSTSSYVPYSPQLAPIEAAELKIRRVNVVATVGFRF
jgi:long-subunit fatty acid transport protein